MANDAVEFVTMLLLNKHYVQHSHVPTLHGQRKELMHLVNHFYPEDDFARVMAKAHKKTNVIHSAFMGREHPLFHGGVVTKAVGVCVDGCQYQPRVREPRVKKRRQVRKARVVVLCACAVGMQRSFVWLVLVVLLTTAQAPYKGSTHSLLESVVTSRSLMFRSLHRWIEIVDRFLLLCRPPSPTPTE